MASDPTFYGRRNQRAQLEGWRSYAHKRAASEESKALDAYDPRIKARFLDVAKGFGAPRAGRRLMKLWIRGAKALVAAAGTDDFSEADEIAAQLPNGIRLDPEKPASVFWYH